MNLRDLYGFTWNVDEKRWQIRWHDGTKWLLCIPDSGTKVTTEFLTQLLNANATRIDAQPLMSLTGDVERNETPNTEVTYIHTWMELNRLAQGTIIETKQGRVGEVMPSPRGSVHNVVYLTGLSGYFGPGSMRSTDDDLLPLTVIRTPKNN